jgi:16S rRNA (cytosine967-C5)-methyltransferase
MFEKMDNIKKFELVSKELFNAIRIIFKDNLYASKAIKISLKANKNWDNETRGFFSDNVYHITRYWKLLWYIIKKEPSFNDNDLAQLLNTYLFFIDEKIPKKEEFVKRLSSAKKIRAIKESIPDWLDKIGQKELGKKWNQVIRALNQKPSLIFRVNTLKITRDELINILKNEGVYAEKIDDEADALLIKNKTNFYLLESFKEGFFEVQDIASQMVSIFLTPEPGMLVIDACAGEGSKTLHIAALMKNRGRIIAMDLQDWRLKELRRRAKRSGAYNIETRQIISSKSYKRLKGKADRLLLDVPCSGLGTLRRNPDIKWKISLSDIDRLKKIQKELLEKYCNLLKPGGRLVYSICSVLPSEGEEQIKDFLMKQNNKFELIEEKRYWPDEEDADGFYMALIERK